MSGRYGKDQMWDLTVEPDDDSATVAAIDPDPVTTAFSRDGSRLATWYRDDTVRIWSARSGQVERILHGVPHAAMAISADGKWFAAPGTAGVELWDMASGDERILDVAAARSVRDVEFSPDGRSLAAVDRAGVVHLMDLASGIETRSITGDSSEAFELTDDGKVTTLDDDDTLRLWDAGSGTKELEVKLDGDLRRVTVAHDGRHVFVGGRDAVVRRVDPAAHTSVVVGKYPGNVEGICVSNDGRKVASIGDAPATVAWDLETGRQLLLPMRQIASMCAWSGDGKQLATVSDFLRVWDAETGMPAWRAPLLRASGELLTHLGWSDLASGATLHPPDSRWRQALATRAMVASESESGDVLCLATPDHVVELWSTADDVQLWSVSVPGAEQVVALPAGCAVRAGNVARFHDRSGQSAELRTDAANVVLDRAGLLIPGATGTRAFDDAGSQIAFYPNAPHAATAARVGPWLALGQGTGGIDLVSLAAGGPERAAVTVEHPDSAVVRIQEGPQGSIIAGYANRLPGRVGHCQRRPAGSRALQGRVVHLLRSAATSSMPPVIWVTARSSISSVGLRFLTYCTLLRQVWEGVPIVWAGGAARLQLPPSDHRCAPGRR